MITNIVFIVLMQTKKNIIIDKLNEHIKSLEKINPKFIYYSVKSNEDNVSIYTLMESKTSDFEVFEDRYKRHLSELENDLFIKKIKLL